MAEDKKKEIKIDELEKVTGGAIERSSLPFQTRYVFTKEEPCMMCAMALIHNRISRLYFSDINQKQGALISKYSLDNYNLNHHYLIFKFN